MNTTESSRLSSRISLDTLMFTLLGFIQLYRYKYFFFPRVKPLVELLPQSILDWIGNPVLKLINNPIERVLVTFGMIFILGYLLSDLFVKQPSRKVALKYGFAVLMIMDCVVVQTGLEIFRYKATGDQVYAHDGGVIQTEAAIELLKQGKNPYFEDYRHTIMNDGYDLNDPPLFHFPYLPFILEFSIPIQMTTNYLFGFFDMRLIYLSCFLLTVFIAHSFGRTVTERLCLISLISLNPLLTDFIFQGRNDTFGLFWMTAAFGFLRRKHRTRGLVCLAAASASKPFAWMMLPFLAVYLWPVFKEKTMNRSILRKALLLMAFSSPFWLTWLLMTGPFLIWDFSAIWEDVYRFNAGLSEINYAFGGTPGFGFPNFIIYFQGIASLNDPYSLMIHQIVVCVPLILLFTVRQFKENSLRSAITAYPVILLAFLFVSRLFHDNYLGYAGAYLCMSVFGSELDDRLD